MAAGLESRRNFEMAVNRVRVWSCLTFQRLDAVAVPQCGEHLLKSYSTSVRPLPISMIR